MAHLPGNASNPLSPTNEATYDISYLLDDPAGAVNNFQELLQMCLNADNPHANFIHGVHEFFGKKNIARGLKHLKRSADSKFDSATYLYGVLMIARGNWVRGKRYLLTLGWKTNMGRADQSWTQVKKSLSQYHIVREDFYVDNMFLIKPEMRCHVDSFDQRCKRCFLYKQLTKFVHYI